MPAGLLEDVLEARAFARAKQMSDDADTAEARKRLPKTPLFGLVKEIEFGLRRQEIDAVGTDGCRATSTIHGE